MTRAARTLLAILAAALIALAAQYRFDLGSPFGGEAFWDRLYNLIQFGVVAVLLMRAYTLEAERMAWLVFAFAVFCFALGDVYWTVELNDLEEIPVPSLADAGYLLFYPAAYIGLGLLVRSRADRFDRSLWLEGIIGGLAAAAVGAALIFQPIIDRTEGEALVVGTSLAYPLADVLLFALVIGVLTLAGTRHAATWLFVGAGFATFALTDAIYGYRVADETYVDGTLLDAGWPAAMVLLGVAAWSPPFTVRASRLEGWAAAIPSAVFGVISLGLLIYGNFADLHGAAVGLAAISLAAVIVRAAQMFVARVRAATRLAASEERYRALTASLPDTVIVLFDKRLRVSLAEGKAASDEGRLTLVPGKHVSELLPPEHADILASYEQALDGRFSTHEIRSGDRVWHVDIGPFAPGGGEPEGVFSVARDVTDREIAQAQLTHQALHDSLTGLANRVLFTDRLQQALARLARNKASLAILFVDLDRFKMVNDSLGHAAGDEVLLQVADRLRRALRPADTIARFGGDEFVIVCEEIRTKAEAEVIVRRVSNGLARPFRVADQDVVLTGSIGVVMNSDPTADPETLLRDADTAMYRAKERGRALFQFFDSSLRMRVVQRLQLENSLRAAIKRGELRVHYQPQVRLADNKVVGCEALVRWADPERGVVPPNDFIPVAEDSGLIVPLGDWVLRRVAWDKRRWTAPLNVSVNLSPTQLADPDLVEKVSKLVQETGVDPQSLCLEVTESALFTDAENALVTLTALRGLGVRLAIDDFGIGFSSLYHLRELPQVDFLKLDSAFVADLGRSRKDSAIVASVIVLANALGVEIVGEGIETEAQARELRDMGCDLGQGYFFGQPRAVRDGAELLDITTPLPQT